MVDKAVIQMSKRILDPCCGSKMFWFDKDNQDVLFCDNRELDEEIIWTSRDGKQTRTITVKPDLVCDEALKIGVLAILERVSKPDREEVDE